MEIEGGGEDLAAFSVEDGILMLAAARKLVAMGILEAKDMPSALRRITPPVANTPTPIYFRNDSAYTIPPYGLLQIVDTVEVTGSFNYIKVKRPIDSTLMRCPLLINGPREVLTNEYGAAQSGPVFRLLHDAAHTYVAGDRMGSLTGTFTATRGSLYAVLGADDIATNVVRCMFDTSTMYGRTKVTGLNYATPANVLVYDAAGTLTAKEYLAETRVSNIPGDTEIELESAYGRWFATEIC